jgi:hypothetical protein
MFRDFPRLFKGNLSNTWLIVNKVSFEGASDDAWFASEIFSKFRYLSFESPMSTADIQMLYPYGARNLKKLNLEVTLEEANNCLFLLSIYASKLEDLTISSADPIPMECFIRFNMLKRLKVGAISYNNASTRLKWSCKYIDTLEVENCVAIQSYAFLRELRVLSVLVLTNPIHLTLPELLPMLQPQLRKLTLINAFEVVTDALLESLPLHLVELHVPLYPCTEAVGFSPQHLMEFLDRGSEVLAEITLRGHRQIDASIWTWHIQLFWCIQKMDLRKTAIRGMAGLDVFSARLHTFRKSLLGVRVSIWPQKTRDG